MNLANIRTYFNDQILLVDPDLEFVDDPFGDDEIGDYVADKYYKLYFGTATFNRNGNHYIEEMPTFVEIYAGRQRDTTASFDEVYTKALEIKDAILCPETDKNNTNFTEIFALSAAPQALPNNDNTIRIIIEFNVIRHYLFT